MACCRIFFSGSFCPGVWVWVWGHHAAVTNGSPVRTVACRTVAWPRTLEAGGVNGVMRLLVLAGAWSCAVMIVIDMVTHAQSGPGRGVAASKLGVSKGEAQKRKEKRETAEGV